jgi:hypothetical protein
MAFFGPDLPDDLSVRGQNGRRKRRRKRFQPGEIGQGFSDGDKSPDDGSEQESRSQKGRPQEEFEYLLPIPFFNFYIQDFFRFRHEPSTSEDVQRPG